jgi:hypothetical protein
MTTRDTPEAALAAALHEHYEHAYTVPGLPHNHPVSPTHLESAAAILAALDGWTLVRGGGDVIERGIELARQQAATIVRLRAALEIIAAKPRGDAHEAIAVSARNIARAALAPAPSEP